jgi:hypothetical protein
LTGAYYDNQDLTNLKLTRIDSTVNFNWGNGAPDPAVASDTFSVRWTGSVLADAAETYTFYTITNDGARLWVDGQLIIDNWTNPSNQERSGTIALTAGWHTLKLEYFEAWAAAGVSLSYASLSTPKQIIPSTHLVP